MVPICFFQFRAHSPQKKGVHGIEILSIAVLAFCTSNITSFFYAGVGDDFRGYWICLLLAAWLLRSMQPITCHRFGVLFRQLKNLLHAAPLDWGEAVKTWNAVCSSPLGDIHFFHGALSRRIFIVLFALLQKIVQPVSIQILFMHNLFCTIFHIRFMHI